MLAKRNTNFCPSKYYFDTLVEFSEYLDIDTNTYDILIQKANSYIYKHIL